MYNLIENVILAGGYKLSDIQQRAKKLYLTGDITEAELDRLLAMASEGVSTDAERPETLEMLRTLSRRMDGIEGRLMALEAHENEGGEEEPAQPDAPAEHEAWSAWDGMSDRYQKGSIVTHNGKVWESVFEGQNVWEPGAAGTASLWVEVTAAETAE